MKSFNLYLLSTYLKKWSFMDNRITLNFSFCFDEGYERSHVDMRLGSPMGMVNELLSSVFHQAKEKISELGYNTDEYSGNNSVSIVLINESEIKRKLGVYLNKIIKEFNNNKRSKGRSRMIATRSLDYYYNDYEFEPLNDDVKFYVHLNRGLNKMSGDLWANAIEDFTKALAVKPKDIMTNRYMAQCMNKMGRHEEALNFIKVYAETDKSPESMDALAAAYIHMNDFDNAQHLYEKLEEQFPESNVALYGKAQLAYKQNKAYRQLLDKIYKKNEGWLREKLRTDWEFRLPGNFGNDDIMWNAATAARYLGFERPFDLTRRAFNEEIPSYFDSEKGTIRFVKEELDKWVDILSRYKVDNEKYILYEDRLTKEELNKAELQKKAAKKNMIAHKDRLIARQNVLKEISEQPENITLTDLPLDDNLSRTRRSNLYDDEPEDDIEDEFNKKLERLVQIKKNFRTDPPRIIREASEKISEPKAASKRGRPRKSDGQTAQIKTPDAGKSHRGRKRKTDIVQEGLTQTNLKSRPDAGDTLPPVVTYNSEASVPVKSRGRRKANTTQLPQAEVKNTEVKKHRGRPRKTIS